MIRSPVHNLLIWAGRLHNIPEFPFDNLDQIPFDNLKKVIDKISEYNRKGIFVFKNKDSSEIITLIA